MLPDGITFTKGFVKDPDEAQRYLNLVSLEKKDDSSQLEVSGKAEEKRTIDLSKNVRNTFSLK